MKIELIREENCDGKIVGIGNGKNSIKKYNHRQPYEVKKNVDWKAIKQ